MRNSVMGSSTGRSRVGSSRLLACCLLSCLPSLAAQTSGAGLSVSVDPGGQYTVSAPEIGWSFAGDIGRPLANLAVVYGADAVGPYTEISFDFQSDAARHAAIRSYVNRPALLFSASNPAPAPNTFLFPNWTRYPQGLNFLTYSGTFATPTFNTVSTDSPWMFFDTSNHAFILSPAANFMVGFTSTAPNGGLASGISPQIASLPQGFQHQTLLVIESGINRAFDTWGQTLTALRGKERPANDADPVLNKLGYWTDRGSAYWYNTAPSMTYEQTLTSVKADFDRHGIPLGYLQLDSWFYPKGTAAAWDGAGGVYDYLAAPALFPEGLANFQRALKTPLVTHARWIDPASPYRALYSMSGNVVLDPAYWSSIASYLKSSGAVAYEQDWLDANALPAFNLQDGDAFLGNMAAGMAQQGLSMQYCMPLPRHILQSSNYSNLTTARISNDRFDSGKWGDFLYASRFASAMGTWPFTDNFRSSETGNLLLATLSAGPVGIGDPIGSMNSANLMRAIRADGVIVKPDVPLTPVDSSYTKRVSQGDAPQVAATYTDFGALRASYLFAWVAGSGRNARFQLADVGITQQTYLYNYFAGTGQLVNPAESLDEPIADSFLYWIAAPVGPSGIAVIGDPDQFVTMGRKRILQMTDDGAVSLTVSFAPGEKARRILGYSAVRPALRTLAGAVLPGSYNAATGLFTVLLSPGPDGTASVEMARSDRNRTPRRSAPPVKPASRAGVADNNE